MGDHPRNNIDYLLDSAKFKYMYTISNKAKDYYRVGMLKSGMQIAVLKKINSTCQCFSKEVILEEFEAYFEVLERGVFHEVLRWGYCLICKITLGLWCLGSFYFQTKNSKK